ncbi:repeat in HS1/Cortactin [Opisthorchis viverrini]|uniref:Repeat in HS1/Cortactin n=1 Tax=Opisthorchis viverrini TaxID=6198 RepID=A0A1S8WQV7_OPIVI|nr:repeat in HS1/Cortactin [Opisthorchis viverrini]
MNTLREEVKQADQQNKLKTAPKPSYGYGGKFGVERDRMDKSAVGWDHREQTAAHPSQTDYAKGFGGKYGVQTDRMDTTAGADQSKDTMQLHPSQMRPEVRGQAGGISALRSQFEYKGQTAASPASCGPTAAQIRMSEERARWETERSKAAANAPPSPPEPQPTHEPQRASVQEPTPEVYPESEQEPAVETTTYPAEHVDQVSELSGSDALTQCTVVALYDYTAEEADELTFSVGELITEVEKIDSGWWKGVCRDKVGLFPSNYVQEQ